MHSDALVEFTKPRNVVINLVEKFWHRLTIIGMGLKKIFISFGHKNIENSKKERHDGIASDIKEFTGCKFGLSL